MWTDDDLHAIQRALKESDLVIPISLTSEQGSCWRKIHDTVLNHCTSRQLILPAPPGHSVHGIQDMLFRLVKIRLRRNGPNQWTAATEPADVFSLSKLSRNPYGRSTKNFLKDPDMDVSVKQYLIFLSEYFINSATCSL